MSGCEPNKLERACRGQSADGARKSLESFFSFRAKCMSLYGACRAVNAKTRAAERRRGRES